MRKGYIPVIRRSQLADGRIIDYVIGQVKAKKTGEPVELATLRVSLSPEAERTLYITAGIFAGGMILSKFL